MAAVHRGLDGGRRGGRNPRPLGIILRRPKREEFMSRRYQGRQIFWPGLIKASPRISISTPGRNFFATDFALRLVNIIMMRLSTRLTRLRMQFIMSLRYLACQPAPLSQGPLLRDQERP